MTYKLQLELTKAFPFVVAKDIIMNINCGEVSSKCINVQFLHVFCKVTVDFIYRIQ